MDVYTVMLRLENPKKRKRTFLRRVKNLEFATRQKARRWCRNHWYQELHEGMVIVHPDGTREEFSYEGVMCAPVPKG